MCKALLTFLRDQSGVTGIEYGVIAFGIALVLISAASSVGHHLMGVFFRILGALLSDNSPPLHS